MPAKQTLEKAMLSAYERGQNYVGTEHCSLAFLR